MSTFSTTQVLDLARALMQRQSVTPDDAGCQDLLAEQLTRLGFECQSLDASDTRNLYAWRQFGEGGPHLMLAGHTDVVPPGPLEAWQSPPFTPTLHEQKLYGRGAADMKSSLAAMVAATAAVCAEADKLSGTLSYLITSDEEGDAVHGTQHAIGELISQGITPDYCIVGEPSSSRQVGDVVRCGRRGSINGNLTINGVQGHVAYPDDASNPVHAGMEALSALTAHVWDEGNEYYPPTSLQISNIHAGTGATNVIPGQLEVAFNVRFSTEQSVHAIQQKVSDLIAPCQLDHRLQWTVSGLPFLTPRGRLTDAVTAAVKSVMGFAPELSTSGGTSDGRFIAPWQQQRNVDGAPHTVDVVELGPTNATIHKINECIHIDELPQLTAIYTRCLQEILGPGTPG